MKPIVEGHPYPVFVEPSELGAKMIQLRVGNHGPGDSQTTQLTLRQARLLAYGILSRVEEIRIEIDRLTEEAKALEVGI